MSGPVKWTPNWYSWSQIYPHLLSMIHAASDLKAFFLQKTTSNSSVTPHGLQGDVQTLQLSVLCEMGLLLQIFFNNSFNYSLIHSAFPCTLLWQRNSPCCHRETFLDLYTVFCISPNGCSTVSHYRVLLKPSIYQHVVSSFSWILSILKD